jgi:integrase
MAIDLFLESMKSPKTREIYSDALRRFCVWSGITEAKLKTTQAKKIQEKLIEHVVNLKNKGLSYGSQIMAISAVRRYCEAYDIDVNFSKVSRYVGEHVTKHDDRPYTKQQIARMLTAADARTKALILLLSSTGVRIGAVPGMLIRDLTKIDDKGLYKVIVYANSPNDKYDTFTTPEAAQAIDAYLEQRRIAGEDIKPSAPLFRQTFPKSQANNPKPLSFDGIAGLTQRAVTRSGVRKVGDRNGRQATAINHGFRKFANTEFIRCGMKPIVAELLLGHRIGLQDNYLRLEESEVLNQYMLAVDSLTVSDAEEWKVKAAKLQATNDKLVEILEGKVAAFEQWKKDKEALEKPQTMQQQKKKRKA